METENMEVQETQNVPETQEVPVVQEAAAPAAKTVQAAPKKNKKMMILAIGIPALVVVLVVGILVGISVHKSNQYKTALEYLDDGDIEEAVEIHGKLGDYKDLGEKVVEVAIDEFDNELDDNEHKKAMKIYAAVVSYPEAIEEMDSKLEKYVSKQLRNYNIDTVRSLFERAEKEEVAVDKLSACIAESAEELLENYEYYSFAEIYDMLSEQDSAVAAMDQLVIDRVTELMDESVYDAINLKNSLADYGVVVEGVQAAMYEKGKEMMDAGEYNDACDVFYSLSQNEYEDSANLYAECNLQYYLVNEYYSSAKSYVDEFEGEQYEHLLAIYLTYCGDTTVIEDLEAAVKARLELEAADADYQALLDAENSYLEKYENMPFYDSSLEDLVDDYLYILYYQQYYLNYYSDYWYLPYYIGQYDADRYSILTLLADYGFGEGDSELQAILGTAEEVAEYWEHWYSVYYDLYYDLRYELNWLGWNDTGYLEATNDTDYVYSALITIEYSDNTGEVVSTKTYEVVDCGPDDKLELDIGVENAAELSWKLTIDITSITDPEAAEEVEA